MAKRCSLIATAALMLFEVPALAQTTLPGNTAPVNMTVKLGQVSDGNALNIKFTAAGSGKLGPQTANHGISVACSKTGFWNAKTTGEIDCLNAVIRQGRPGDSSGLQIDTENTGSGFLAVEESAASSVNTRINKVMQSIDIQEGVIPSGGNSYGFVATNNSGGTNTMFLGQTNNNTHATSLLKGLDNGQEYFSVDGRGNTWQAGNAYVAGQATIQSARIVTTPIWNKNASYAIVPADCGVTFRDTMARNHIYTVSKGLPLGCDVRVIQAGTGAVVFIGSGVVIEEREGLGKQHVTADRFSEAELLIDGASTALLRGDVR